MDLPKKFRPFLTQASLFLAILLVVGVVSPVRSAVANPVELTVHPHWQYQNSYDRMRGTSSHMAVLESANSVNFDFPYNGGSKLSILLLRTRPGGDQQVQFIIDKGQLLSDVNRYCRLNAKFDNGPVLTFWAIAPSNGRTDLVYLPLNHTKFIKLLKKAHHVIVEAPFFQEGRRQFDFYVSGLSW